MSDQIITEAVVRARPPNQPFIVSYGAGVDSTGTLVNLHRKGLRPDAVVFADTGGEKPATYAYIATVNEFLRYAKFPEVTVVRYQPRTSTYRTLEEESLQKSTLPSKAFGFGRCSDKWKVRAQSQWLRQWEPAISARKDGVSVIRAISFEAGEEHRMLRAKEDAGAVIWYPLIEWGWTREECIEAVAAVGLMVPPKSACFFCPSSKKAEILQLAKDHPELAARAVAMEDRARPGLTDIVGLGRRFSWRTFLEADEEGRKAIPEAIVEACSACTDDSDCRR